MPDVAAAALALVDPIYDAVAGSASWAPFLDGLAAAVGGLVPALVVDDRASDVASFIATPGLDPTWGRRYDAYFVHRDVRRPRIKALAPGSVFVGQQLIPDSELIRSEFYDDFLRPQGFFHILGGVVLKDERRVAVVRVIRPKAARPFGARERAILERLMPHLARGLRLHRQLAAAEAERDAGHEVLDRFPTGVVLLSADGLVLAASRSAAAVLALRDGLAIEGGRLQAATARDAGALEQLIAGAAARSDDAAGGALTLARPSGRRPLGVLIAPLRAGLLARAEPHAAIVVFVSDPERRLAAPAERLRRYLGLTAAEARLVLALAQGHGVAEAAAALSISVQTARTQLKRALTKTNTHRQADLVRLALTSPAALGAEPAED